MSREFDCIVCGETCVDLTVRPVDRSKPLAQQGTFIINPIQVGTGGIVPNSGMALAKMGMKSVGLGCVGTDDWAELLIGRLNEVAMVTDHMIRMPNQCTSATAILVDSAGEHNFAFHPGASTGLQIEQLKNNFSLFENSRFALFGYYGLWSDEFASELPSVLAEIRRRGCRTALDAAAGGGTMQPLNQILPHLDVYIPSLDEARSQTGCSDPHDMLRVFREFNDDGLLGVKLGSDGAILSPADNQSITIPPVSAPGRVIDTTGAGDCFYAGLICGLLRGYSISQAGRLGAAAGACSVTQEGATTGLPEMKVLCDMAGVSHDPLSD